MNILEVTLRRIIKRVFTKAISPSKKKTSYKPPNYNAETPSTTNLIFNVFLFVVLTFSISSLFLSFHLETLAYITPLFFIIGILHPLFTKHIYGKKVESFTVPDRRFKSGRRTEGHIIVKDEKNKIYFTEKQLKISRLEGLIKIIITVFLVLYVYLSINTVEHKLNNLSEKQLLNSLKAGDTVFAKSGTARQNKINPSVEIFSKEKKTTYDLIGDEKFIISEKITYEVAFFEDSKKLGYFVRLDTDTLETDNLGHDKFVVLKYKKPNTKNLETKHTMENQDQNTVYCDFKRLDNLFYVKLSDITISEAKLQEIK